MTLSVVGFERNLHDAAQQAVLALSYDVRLALAAARKSGRRDLDQLLQRATTAVQDTVDELRQLAHGIYPAVLTDHGLRPAFASLAASAPVRVEIGDVVGARLPPLVERTAYLAAADVINQAASAGTDELTIAAETSGSNLVVEIRAPTSLRQRHCRIAWELWADRSFELQRFSRVEIPCG